MIRVDGDTQSRAGIDPETVKKYLRDLEQGHVFEPIDVFFNGKNYWLAGGFHRVEAYRNLIPAEEEIQARVHEGTVDDARLFSYSENQKHGRQRTNEDIEFIVKRALGDPLFKGKADRALADILGVGSTTIARWREKLPGAPVEHLPQAAPEPGPVEPDQVETGPVEPEPAPTLVPEVARVVGRDGKKYPAKKNQKPNPAG